MELSIYQVDAFAEKVFGGNPAAVVPLSDWLSDQQLQAIAEENNLSETAFIVAADKGYQLRWFTPAAEVDLCGHATLAAAHVVFNHLNSELTTVRFSTRSGELVVEKSGSALMMDFPATQPTEVPTPAPITEAIDETPEQVLLGFDHIVVLASAQQVRQLQPDLTALKKLDSRGVVFTAEVTDEESEYDFVSRCFYPKLNVPEDPVTGSAHCQLAPYWASRLAKSQVVGRQASKRGGSLDCQVSNDRVRIAGAAVDYLIGTIKL